MDLRAVLVDDEGLAREELRYLLEQLGGVEVVGDADNGILALETIEQRQPDLVFLDVQMPGLTGFQVARRMIDRGSAAQIIFVTAFDQQAVQAFDVNAIDYLLKPVDPSRLATALDRARRRIGAERATSADASPAPMNMGQLERLVQMMAERQGRRDQVAIKVGEKFMLVQADEIYFASLADESITVAAGAYLGTSNYRTLDELQARLDPEVFWRVHRSHLVNINKIKEIVPWFSRNYILRMKDEKATEIPVSRTQTRRLRDYLKL